MENNIFNHTRFKPYPTDYFLNKTILPLVPRWVRPNHITILRFITAPIVFWLLWQGNYQWGLPVFLFVAFTDALDGAIARLRNQITPWGIIFDPVADKILIGGSLLILIWKIHPFLVLAVILMETVTIAGGFYLKLKGRLCPANNWGKAKMVLQVLAVAVFLIGSFGNLAWLYGFSALLLIASLIFAIISFLSRGL